MELLEEEVEEGEEEEEEEEEEEKGEGGEGGAGGVQGDGEGGRECVETSTIARSPGLGGGLAPPPPALRKSRRNISCSTRSSSSCSRASRALLVRRVTRPWTVVLASPWRRRVRGPEQPSQWSWVASRPASRGLVAARRTAGTATGSGESSAYTSRSPPLHTPAILVFSSPEPVRTRAVPRAPPPRPELGSSSATKHPTILLNYMAASLWRAGFLPNPPLLRGSEGPGRLAGGGRRREHRHG